MRERADQKDEQTTTAYIATFTGAKPKKKRKKKRKAPLALTKSGISTPIGYEDTTNGSMSQFGGHPPYSDRNTKKRKVKVKQAVEDAVMAFVERALQPGPGRKKRSRKEMRKFLKKRGLLGIPRQRMK